MNDYLLRTDTKQQMDAALSRVGLLDGERLAEGVFVDYIGAIPAVFDIEGEEIKPSDTRFHANLRTVFPLTADQVAGLPTFAPLPAVPYRVFA